MTYLLLTGSLVILSCILCNHLTSRFGIPMLLALGARWFPEHYKFRTIKKGVLQ
ncbi:MAG: hypothetical protein HFG64_02140 [Lachnospiraceae bacterium]|nr:hypothetical protein [Lachnospiraceae bacterium]